MSLMSSILGALLSLSVILFLVKAETARSVSAIFIFGDSTSDPGNNNGLNTIFKCNFLPYGRDFPTHQPTGRFCNGRLVTDFIAEELGLKETVPAYLDPQLKTQDLLTGVSYASSAAGYDDLTAHHNKAVPLSQQVEYFKAHVDKLKKVVGEKNTSNIVRNALYGISIGSNDILDNYFLLPIRRKEFSVEQYQDFLVKKAEDFTKELYHLGARKLGVLGLPPLGCLPVERYVRLQTIDVRPCVEKTNQVAMTYNEKLQAAISNLKPELPGMKVVYIDIYNVLFDAIQNPSKYGFGESTRGCCGTGLVEIGFTCNEKSVGTCDDASNYVFWDAIHPSEKMNKIIAHLVLHTYRSQLSI